MDTKEIGSTQITEDFSEKCSEISLPLKTNFTFVCPGDPSTILYAVRHTAKQ